MKNNTLQNRPEFNNLLDLASFFPDEKACREFLIKERWNGKPICVHCGYSEKVYSINEGKLLKCAKCRKQFTVRVGSIFEDSALPLRKWFMAIYIFMAHKKGISSVQLAKDISVTQRTAWFMLHRIRYAVRTRSLKKPLDGVVEADETFVGGKMVRDFGGQTESTNKAIVFGMKQRNGKVIAQTIKNRSAKTIQKIIRENISPDAVLMTDEWGGYKGLDDTYDAHGTVNHKKKEYVRGEIHTNSIESFWALFKRGYVGTYHYMSKKHLDKYVDEFEFRYNFKNIADPKRFGAMLSVCEGRLTYRNLVKRKYTQRSLTKH
jgi:transposase-like protein